MYDGILPLLDVLTSKNDIFCSLSCYALNRLPSEHDFIKSKVGFSPDVNMALYQQAKVEEYKKCVGILFDEVKIKDNLVFDKVEGNVVGRVNIGEFNNELDMLEKESSGEKVDVLSRIATHILVFMVRGICTAFATQSLTASQLVWECRTKSKVFDL